MPLLEFLGTTLAKTIASKVVDGSVNAIRRRLAKPEATIAFEAAIREALAEALPDFLPKSYEDDEVFGNHLKDLLERFLTSDAVVDELTNLIDTRIDGEFDHEAVIRQFEEEHERPRLDGFDLEGFLRASSAPSR